WKGTKNVAHLLVNPREVVKNLLISVTKLASILDAYDGFSSWQPLIPDQNKINEIEKLSHDMAHVMNDLKQQFDAMSFTDKIEKVSEFATEWLLTDGLFKATGSLGKAI